MIISGTCVAFKFLAVLTTTVVTLPSVMAVYDYYYDQKPLLLSPLLDAGKADEARRLAQNKVHDRTGYSGYFTTDKKCGNHLFTWFFPALHDPETAPIVLWLNGGPGSTSMFGLFAEIGRWNWIKGRGLVPNKWAWTDDHSVLFIDRPVGVGFSFTEGNCYQHELNTTTRELHSALVQFFVMFPDLRKNAFYLAGESFAGHYIPRLARQIDVTNAESEHPINMVAILIVNGFMDAHCYDNGAYLHQMGALTHQEFRVQQKLFKALTKVLEEGDTATAASLLGTVANKITNIYNIVYDEKEPAIVNDYMLYLKDIRTRDLIHVGYSPFIHNNHIVQVNLKPTMLMPVSDALEHLLDAQKYMLVFLTGQMDTVTPPAAVECALRNINWAGTSQFYVAPRLDWTLSGRVAAWYRSVGPLMEVIVRNAGHFVPTDQPDIALDILKKTVQITKHLAK